MDVFVASVVGSINNDLSRIKEHVQRTPSLRHLLPEVEKHIAEIEEGLKAITNLEGGYR